MTGVFVELEDARINYDAAATARTGLRGGWGLGARLGVDFKDWVPVHLGLRHAAPNDGRSFTEPVVHCVRTPPGGPTRCDAEPRQAMSTVGGVVASFETGVEPNIRLASGVALSPSLLLGYLAPVVGYERSIERCQNCRVEAVDLQVHTGYGAASLRLTAHNFGIALRYERFFRGDLRDAIAIAIAINFGFHHRLPH